MASYIDMDDVPIEYTLNDFHRDWQSIWKYYERAGIVYMDFAYHSYHLNFNTGWVSIAGPEYFIDEASLITFSIQDIADYLRE